MRHRRSRGLAGLAGVALRHQPSKSALRVVGAFVMGRQAQGACKVPKSKGEARDCNYRTDGIELRVKGLAVGTKRPSAITAKTIQVCPGDFGRGVESAKAASALLSVLGAGVGLQNRDGKRYFRGRGSTGRIETEGCFNVDVSKKIRVRAQRAFQAEAEAGRAKSAKSDINKARAEFERVAAEAQSAQQDKYQKRRFLKEQIATIAERHRVRVREISADYQKGRRRRLTGRKAAETRRLNKAKKSRKSRRK